MDSHPAYFNVHSHTLANASEIVVYNVFPEIPNPVLSPNTLFSSGIHPWYLENWEEKMDFLIRKLAANSLVAIGESGLDIYASFPMNLQEKIFKMQADLAEKFKKPLIVHCVKTFNELLKIHTSSDYSMPWIIHGFTGGPQIAQKCVSQGMIISFGKHLFNDNIRFLEVAKNISIAHVLLETDNSERTISEIYERFSFIRNLDLFELNKALSSNFTRIFLF